MAVKPGPVLVLAAKWLLIPIALGVVGYFVGTNIGSSPGKPAQNATSSEVDEDSETNYPEPEVDVTVSRGSDVTQRRSTSTRRRSSTRTQPRREEPRQEEPKEQEPPQEETRERPVPITEPPTTSGDGGNGGDGDGETTATDGDGVVNPSGDNG